MSANTHKLNILNLNDYILLNIFRYLNLTDLWLISKTCQRLHDIVQTKYLWYKIDARDLTNNNEKIDFCIDKITNTTEDVRISADGRHIKLIPDNFFLNISTLNLSVLALENMKIDGNMLKLRDFPETLIELSLKKTYVTNTFELQKYYPEQLKNLKVFILDQCFWVNLSILDRLESLKSLEILSLYKCKGLYDVELSITKKFDSLRIVDCRFSGLGNIFLQSLAKKPKVQEIYFQDYLTTYFVEKDAREVEIADNSQKLKNSYVSDLDDIALWNEDILHNFVGSTSTIEKIPYGHLSETSIKEYSSAKPIQGCYTFQSTLYKRPYDECTCQNNPNIAARIVVERKKLTVSDDDIERKVCKGGFIYTLKPTESSKMMGISRLNSADISENPNQNEKDIAVLEHSSHWWWSPPRDFYRMDVPGSFLWRRYPPIESNEYQEPHKINRCGNAGMAESRYLGQYNDVSLKKLSLRGCYGVTDKALHYLKHLNLSLLDVTGTRVTAEGVKNFVLENVDCRVIHETMCICRPNMHF
ncbi:uncharacterized protein [Onthophagus taurus]|uniref:uncharacterized protein n=1 Tax=Onthophagus taurus TaxID=166361 RepID=UPI0039BDAFAD